MGRMVDQELPPCSEEGHRARISMHIDTKIQIEMDGFDPYSDPTRAPNKKFHISFLTRNDDIMLRYCARGDKVVLNYKEGRGSWHEEEITYRFKFPVSRPCVITFRYFEVGGTRKWEVDSDGGHGAKVCFEDRLRRLEQDPECWIEVTRNVRRPIIRVERIAH